MGKSKKLAIRKNKCSKHDVYHRIIRTNINQKLRAVRDINDAEDLELPNPKEIIHDWNYSDSKYDYEYDFKENEYDETRKGMRRK